MRLVYLHLHDTRLAQTGRCLGVEPAVVYRVSAVAYLQFLECSGAQHLGIPGCCLTAECSLSAVRLFLGSQSLPPRLCSVRQTWPLDLEGQLVCPWYGATRR